MFPTLNLLPPSYQKELRRVQTLTVVHEIFLFLFIAIALGSLILLTAHFILAQKFREVVLEDVPGASKIERLNRDIRLINKELSAIDFILQHSRLNSSVIYDLFNATPPDLTFSLFQINRAGAVEIHGAASNRTQLLEFKRNLAAIPYLLSVDLPLQFLAQEKNINFRLTATLDLKRDNP